MPGITLEQAAAQLALYLAAEAAVLTKQSYKIGERQLTLADLEAIQQGIKTWNDRVQSLTPVAGRSARSRTIVAGW
jgi:hypothetical protein